MCLVWGVSFGELVTLSAPLLSSKTHDHSIVLCSPLTFILVMTSCNNAQMGITSHMAWDKAMYSASVVDKAISC